MAQGALKSGQDLQDEQDGKPAGAAIPKMKSHPVHPVHPVQPPWPKVRLGEVLTPVERGEIPVPGKTYRQIGVRLWGEGAYEREPIDGGATKYAQLFRAEAGDVVVNKIWARNGSVAIVPELLAGCYGSGEFPMFAPNRD
ncbi:MAG: hypothetical protein RMK20_15800, partial [Verrucomicrobiales bacterium]|nr:hypothetical protein [Verrucomicrobiales bacterium]